MNVKLDVKGKHEILIQMSVTLEAFCGYGFKRNYVKLCLTTMRLVMISHINQEIAFML